jgi:hypothetical protein
MNSSMHVWCLMCAFGMQRVVLVEICILKHCYYGPHMGHCAVLEESSFCWLPSGFLLKILFRLTRCVYFASRLSCVFCKEHSSLNCTAQHPEFVCFDAAMFIGVPVGNAVIMAALRTNT